MIAMPAAILASGFAENVHKRKQEYNLHVEHFLKDGVIDESERSELEELRRELGLDSEEALRLLHTKLQEARQAAPKACPHCGEDL